MRKKLRAFFANLPPCRIGMEACGSAPTCVLSRSSPPIQQDIQALHRLRERRIGERTALSNQLLGLLAEYGLILPKGIHSLRRQLPAQLEDAENGLSDLLRRLLFEAYRQLQELDVHIDAYTQELRSYSQQNEACQRLMTIPGFGPIVASVFYSVVAQPEAYRRGRDVSATLGWCHDSTALATSRCCWASASVVTATRAAGYSESIPAC